MTTRRAVQADRRAAVQFSAALLTCVLALTLATVTRSSTSQHHLARAKAAVGVSASEVNHAVARSDLHAVTNPASGVAGSHRFATSEGHPVAHLHARTSDTTRVRGPPERAA